LVDILIPTYNRNSRLETCLYALTLQEPKLPENHRIIICDDFPPESSESTVDQFKNKLNIEYYQMDNNTGTSAVRRFLISKITQKFIMWLDDDVILHKDAIRMHLDGCSAENPGISVGTMEDIPEANAEEILKLPLVERLEACSQKALPEARHQFKNPTEQKRAWGGCWTGNLMMLKEHGDKVGWLDEEAVGWGHDDTILTVKLVGEGFPFWYDINIRGYHLRQDAGRKGNLGMGYWETAGKNAEIMNKYLKKYNITWPG
jgi:glycosyltransferase involved in cell wall biosynthesis